MTNTVSAPKGLTVFGGKVEIKQIITNVMKENERGNRSAHEGPNLSQASG